jgi:O-antigen ligase
MELEHRLDINKLWYYYAVILSVTQVISVFVSVSITPLIIYPIMASAFLLFLTKSKQDTVYRTDSQNIYLKLYTLVVLFSVIPFCLMVRKLPTAYFVSVLAFFVPFALFRAKFSPIDFRIRVKFLIDGLLVGFIVCLIFILLTGRFVKSSTEGNRFISGMLGPALISRLSIYVVLYCLLRIFDARDVLINYLLLGFGLIMLIISGSKIGIASLILIGFVILVLKLNKKKTIIILPFLAFLFFFLNLNKRIHDKIIFLTEYQGANAKGVKSLNGRTLIWEDVLIRIRKSFYFGYGYGSPRIILSKEYDSSLRIDILQAHNAWLESMLNVGIIGTVFLLFTIIKTFLNLFKILKLPDDGDRFYYVFISYYLFYHLIRGVTEASFAQASTVEVIVFFSFILIVNNAIMIKKISK